MKSVKKTLLLPRIFFWRHSEACKERNFWENLFFTATGVTSKRKMLNRFSLGNILSLEVLRNNILGDSHVQGYGMPSVLMLNGF